jgi:hypothetical protein
MIWIFLVQVKELTRFLLYLLLIFERFLFMIELNTINLPQARTAGIIEQNSGNELLIYDLQINKAYNLNETSIIVFRACGGKQTFEDLKRKHNYTDDLIDLTLQKLNENNLLTDYEPANHFAGLSRREVIRKVGLGTMIALPIISSLFVPSAANAASNTCGLTCTNPGNCGIPCSNCFGNGTCTVAGAPPEPCSNIGSTCTVTVFIEGEGGISTPIQVNGTCAGSGICS